MSLQKYATLTLSQQRQVGAIVGAVVADAAVCPFQWQYDKNKIKHSLKSAWRMISPEFFQNNQSPIFVVGAGENSCYGDLVKCSLETLSRSLEPDQDPVHELRQRSILKHFGKESRYYQTPLWRKIVTSSLVILGACIAMVAMWSETHPIVVCKTSPLFVTSTLALSITVCAIWFSYQAVPLQGKWVHPPVARFLQTGQGSSQDSDPEGLSLALPMMIRHIHEGNREKFSTIVLRTLHILQKNQPIVSSSVLAFAEIVKLIVNDCNSDQAGIPSLRRHIEHVIDTIDSPEERKSSPLVHDNLVMAKLRSAIEDIDGGCSKSSLHFRAGTLPHNLQGSIWMALRHGTSFANVTRQIVFECGDVCSRGIIAGALVGALHGVGGKNGIPVNWIDRTNAGRLVLSQSIEMVARSSSSS